ncbi:MAG TPA: hypothetical protein V6C63_19985 [Allocoleopsis sp.]
MFLLSRGVWGRVLQGSGLDEPKESLKLVLKTLLSQWQITLAQNEPIRAVRVGALLRPETGVNLVVQGQRSHPAQLKAESSTSSSNTGFRKAEPL